jgi:MYXO-CTERM domain-containing protein
VMDELDSLDPGPKPKGCQTGGAPTPLLLFLVSMFLLGLRRRRR